MSLVRPTLSAVIAANRKGLAVPGDQAWDSHKVGNGYFPLLDYALADTFTRATEAAFVDPRPVANGGTGSYAWDFVGGSAAANWKASGVPRIYTDGAVLIEGARTNYVTQSSDASTWTTAGTVITTAGQAAPDGSTSAYRIADNDAAIICSYTQTLGTLSIATHVYSVKVLKDSDETRFPEFHAFQGSAVITGGNWNVQINTKTGATNTRVGTPTSVSVDDAGLWWILRVTFAVTTGGSAGTRIYPAAGATLGTVAATATGAVTAWGVTVEAGAFPTSDIRTAGAAATRNLDALSFVNTAPEALNSGKFTIDVWPTWASTALAVSTFAYILRFGASILYLYQNAGTMELRVDRITTGAAITPHTLTFSAGQKLTITIDWPNQLLTLAGATTGNGTEALSHTNWNVTVGAATLNVGGGTSGRELHGVIGRPVAA